MTDLIKFSPSELEGKKTLFEETLTYVASVELKNEDSLIEANALLKDLKAELKAIDEMKTSATKPMNESLKIVRAWFRPLEDLGEAIEAKLKQKIATCTLALRKKAEEDSQKLLAAADSSDYNTLTTLVQEAQVAPTLKGTSVREVWVATIAYPNAVPRDWCVPDDKRIAAHARNTPIEQAPTPIAGVTFMKKAVVSARS
jgi:hypothetical protein